MERPPLRHNDRSTPGLKCACFFLDVTAEEDQDYVLHQFPAEEEVPLLSRLKGVFVATRDVMRAATSTDVQVASFESGGEEITVSYWHWENAVCVLALQKGIADAVMIGLAEQLLGLLLFMFGSLEAILMESAACDLVQVVGLCYHNSIIRNGTQISLHAMWHAATALSSTNSSPTQHLVMILSINNILVSDDC